MWRSGFSWLVACAGVVAVAAGAVWLAGCIERRQPGEGPAVVASIFPLGSVAEQIVGEQAEVATLLPPGRTTHGFELSPRRLGLLADADVLLLVGLGVDDWAEAAARRHNPQVRILRMADLVDHAQQHDVGDHHHHHDHNHHHHDHDHTGPNPHLWLDPLLMRQFVQAIGPILATELADDTGRIEAGAQTLARELDELHEKFAETLADVRRRELVTFHNAFDLLADRYDLRVAAHLSPIETGHGGEVPPARLRAAIDVVRQFDLRAVYAEPQFPDDAVRALARQAGVTVLRLDPIGHPDREGYDSYQAMMRSNLATLLEGQNLE